jgi:hypothetical protein
MASLDYDEVEQMYGDETPQSPESRNLAAFERYSQDNLPRRIREAFEAMLEERVLPIEDYLKKALPEVVRTCQAQIFRDWAQLRPGVGQATEGEFLTRNPEMDGIPDQLSHDEQSLAARNDWSQHLSNFYVEPAPTTIENTFNIPVQSNENGEGPSQTTADSGYHSTRFDSDFVHREVPSSPTPMAVADNANMFSFQEDLQDLGVADLVIPADFDWADFLLELENKECSKV